MGATGLPMGMWAAQEFGVRHLYATAGDTLVLCSDGVTETEDPNGRAYGFDRFIDVASRCRDRRAADLLATCLEDLTGFRSVAAPIDDLTLMAIRRAD